MKSIYNDDLSINSEGFELKCEAEDWFKSILEKYPDHNPREIGEFIFGTFTLMVARRILELRRAGVLGVKND